MIHNYIALSFCVLISVVGSAQTATEAERFSISDPLGTARNLGVGNSMFAIGPDMSAIVSNPAGIGGFWRSEFTISGNLAFNHFQSYFSTNRDQISEGQFNPFSMPNIAFVIVNSSRNNTWKTSNWAIGLNRVAEYREEIQFAGNPIGSITDSWSENAEGQNPDELNGFEEGLAYTSGAIYDFEEDRVYETDYKLSPEYNLFKNEGTIHEGGKSELYFGYGANLDNVFLFGASFNMPFINFTEYRTYREADGNEDGVPFFNDLEYNRFINTTGYGVNGKFGITFQPVKNFHISFAAHTPTKFFMTDNYNTSMYYDYTDENHDGPIFSESPYGSFQYALVTPWSLAGGIGIIAGTSGFISASIKWTDFSTMRYDYSVRGNGPYYSQDEQEVNEDIRRIYSTAINLNFGGEMVFQSWRLRGGVSLVQQPYTNDGSMDPSYHAGFGYRLDDFYVDFGYKLTKNDSGYLPYETNEAPQPLVLTDYSRHNITATVGFKF